MSVDSSFAGLYAPPIAFLPVARDLPAADNSPLDGARLGPALSAAVETAEHLLGRLQNGVVTFGQIESALARLDDRLAVLVGLLAPLLPTTSSAVDAQAHQVAVDDFGPLLAEACAIYDSYFGVVRLPAMTLLQLIAQVGATTQAILRDLPYTLLDRTQIVMLIANAGRMLATLGARLTDVSQGTIEQPPVSGPGETARLAYRQGWAENPGGKEPDQAIAFYRWKVGHHFFDLCAIFCGDALRRAYEAVTAGDEQKAVEQLALADSLLRGTTAAMWYAGDFPTSLYRDAVRPSMVMPGQASGFSGDQNADYNRMKDAKEKLKEHLCQLYGMNLAGIAPRLRAAFLSFHEADIEDNEHHLIIAAHKVGMDQSLAQKEWQDELPVHVHRQKAVDVLREMAESKRREFAGA